MTTPEASRYTTIGDMARDSRAIGYDYATPAVPDSRGAAPVQVAAGAPQADGHLYVLFPGVRCIQETYILDVFVNLAQPTPEDLRGPHYVGRMTRLGMGVEDDKGRCVAHGITRIMDATHNAKALRLASGSPVTVTLLVRRAHSGKLASAADYNTLPGFSPTAEWGGPMPEPAPRTPERKTPCD
jgi:tyrosinase